MTPRLLLLLLAPVVVLSVIAAVNGEIARYAMFPVVLVALAVFVLRTSERFGARAPVAHRAAAPRSDGDDRSSIAITPSARRKALGVFAAGIVVVCVLGRVGSPLVAVLLAACLPEIAHRLAGMPGPSPFAQMGGHRLAGREKRSLRALLLFLVALALAAVMLPVAP